MNGTHAQPKPSEDIESQTVPAVSSAPPVVAQPIREPTPTVIYVTEMPAYNPYGPSPLVYPAGEDRHPGLLPCAIVGFIFSWIPIIGIITYCINFDAPLGSQRRMFAQMACFVAMIIILINIIFWSFY
jgi:hypothetical protein